MSDRLLDYLPLFLLLLVYSIPIGKACRVFGIWLSDVMEYNKLLWVVRYKVILKHTKNKYAFRSAFVYARSTEPDVRRENINNVYEAYLTYRSEWISCEHCIASRVLVLVSIIFICITGIELYLIFPFLLFSLIGFYL